MDENTRVFLDFITRHELEDYLSDDGKTLIFEMRKMRETERYENWLDECEAMGMDREFARSISSPSLPDRDD